MIFEGMRIAVVQEGREKLALEPVMKPKKHRLLSKERRRVGGVVERRVDRGYA